MVPMLRRFLVACAVAAVIAAWGGFVISELHADAKWLYVLGVVLTAGIVRQTLAVRQGEASLRRRKR